MPKLTERAPIPVQAAMLRAVVALPKRLRRRIAGKPIVIEGQELALDAQLLLTLNRMSGVTLTEADVATSRAALEAAAGMAAGKPIGDIETREFSIPTPTGGMRARLYTPERLDQPAPLLVYYHGGGWVLGSLDTHDHLARFLARHAGLRVLSVDYRLAPEHPFPAAVDDAIVGFEYAHAHADELGIDPARIAVGGDSAGGNLAAVVAQHATRSDGPAPAFQLLIYPEVDFSVRRRSRDLFAEGFFLTSADMDFFEAHYVPVGTDKSDPQLSPLCADDLTGLPAACIVTAGFDPLRDSGEDYAAALKKAGVPVVVQRQGDLIHGFANFIGVGPRFRDATLEIASALRTGLDLLAT